MSYDIEMLWTCSVCRHGSNRGLKDRYCCNCGHKKDESDAERMPDDMTEAAALKGDDALKAHAGPDWVCKFCDSLQNQCNKCCGNCGATERGTKQAEVGTISQLVTQAEAEHIGREVREDFEEAIRETEARGRELDAIAHDEARSDSPVSWSFVPTVRRWYDFFFARAVRRIAFVTVLVLVAWALWWLFTPRLVEAKVSQLYWQHDTLIERYALHGHEGWTPSFDAVDVSPRGLRHHHYDRVHVGSHRESYSESYACGETCSTSPSYTTCSSNGNGTARCTKHGGNRSCSTKYCSRTAYRTVQDYENVSRSQVWYAWRAWDWSHERTVTRSGFTHATTWPAEGELQAWLSEGEKERSSRQASYKVTFSDVKDGETHFIRPSAAEFQTYDLGERYRLKVNNAGSVEVLP